MPLARARLALVAQQLRHRGAHGADRGRHRAADGLCRAPYAQPAASRGANRAGGPGLRRARGGDRGRRAGAARPARQRARRLARGGLRRQASACCSPEPSSRWCTPTWCGCSRSRCRPPTRGSPRSRRAWKTRRARSAPRPAAALARVHVPLLAPSLATAALLVFVDVLKELPATFALRPFNFDTLAVEAYNLAKDERLAEAAAAFAGDRCGGIAAGDLRLEDATSRRRGRRPSASSAGSCRAPRRSAGRCLNSPSIVQHRVVDLDARHHRPLVVAVGEVALRLVARQVLEELDRRVAVAARSSARRRRRC